MKNKAYKVFVNIGNRRKCLKFEKDYLCEKHDTRSNKEKAPTTNAINNKYGEGRGSFIDATNDKNKEKGCFWVGSKGCEEDGCIKDHKIDAGKLLEELYKYGYYQRGPIVPCKEVTKMLL